jgi:pimeloyl-ACP methyl ester carboxylesterase
LAAAGLGLAVIAWSRNYVIHDIPLTAALDGELVRFRGRRSGELAYYVAGPARRAGSPLVLVHSINAAASSYEMKPLFDHYARTRRVIALDLPGFGFSDRSDRTYSPVLYRDAILDLVEQEVGGVSVDAVGLSLGGEFLAMAGQAAPLMFRSLTFLSPTGLSHRNEQVNGNDALLTLLRVPFWSRPIFDLLTSRPSLKFFLDQSMRTTVSRDLAAYAYATSHQPNAEIAPFYFVAAKLFTPSIFTVYRALTQPCGLIFGQDKFTDYDRVDELLTRTNWRALALDDARALVHWDDLPAVIDQMDKVIAKS